MIELVDKTLSFRFPQVHEDAVCKIDFQRTLRIPDDNREYPLPPGLGSFPIHHVDDFAENLPESWRAHGGVFIPMYQAEALWLSFLGRYPCAVKIAAGKINAVTGESWTDGLSRERQDYVTVPDQPWLDGFNVSEDLIRQFVAMPLGEGYTAEEQISGSAEHGGLQIVVYPMKKEKYAEYERSREAMFHHDAEIHYSPMSPDMGLAPGGLMRQEIFADRHGVQAWDADNGSRCFVHLANSEQYMQVTGRQPPHKMPTALDYTSAGLPWFEYYDDSKAVSGSGTLAGLDSVAATKIKQGKQPLQGNEPVLPTNVKKIGKSAKTGAASIEPVKPDPSIPEG